MTQLSMVPDVLVICSYYAPFIQIAQYIRQLYPRPRRPIIHSDGARILRMYRIKRYEIAHTKPIIGVHGLYEPRFQSIDSQCSIDIALLAIVVIVTTIPKIRSSHFRLNSFLNINLYILILLFSTCK